ncbi:hypothetical protein NCCP1664_05930 [Zafaria cholistanensis]|uniref:Uncharacterized protein n=1 Tax=Zafaria cholistanensis TaxID=1682741 RepID=A0A5A7NNJ3_9MICC|nr:hypothetical protein [Zafaria cholistanensis]GER22096.1 hypothetical protein NCCP1664_05930 [Zafaria cholistanensis]
MPWWSWTLLWMFLAVAAALFVVLCGIRLFRGFMRLLDDAGEAMDRLRPGAPRESARGDAGRAPAGVPVGVEALFQDPGEARRHYRDGRRDRREARRERRIARKRSAGQPQRWRDLYPL